jgi:glycosyltransferase involved in cell wall biosynthesis
LKKNILIWSASYQPVLGGLQTATGTLAEGLSSAGNNIVVLTNRVPFKLPKFELINGVPVYRFRFFHPILPIYSFKSLLIALYGFCIFPFRLLQVFFLIRSLKPDIINIHFPSQQIWWMVIFQKVFRNIEWIMSLHGDDILQFFESRDGIVQPRIKKNLSIAEKIKMHFLKSCLFNSTNVTTCSHYLMNLTLIMMRDKPFKGRVVYNGIDFGRFETNREKLSEQKYLFAFGRLTYAKGFDMLIKCFKRLLDQKKDHYKLIIGGTGEELTKLIKLAKDFVLEDKIMFPGRLSLEDIDSYLQHSALTVIPSRREPFGISLLEAIGARANVVATNIGGMPEIAVYGEVLLCQPDEDSLFKAIQERLDKPVFPGSKNTPGLDRIFTKENMIDQFTRIMNHSNETTVMGDSVKAHLFQESIQA